MKKVKILIANRFFLMNYAIKCIIQRIPGFDAIGVSEENIFTETEKFLPDIVIIEAELIKANSPDLLKKLKTNYVWLKILVLLDNQNLENSEELLHLDLEGYLLQTISREELINAIKQVSNGKTYHSPEITEFMYKTIQKNRLNEPQKEAELLSDREEEILGLIVSGFNNKQIADRLFISPHTVQTHRKNIMRKKQVNSSSQLIITTLKEK